MQKRSTRLQNKTRPSDSGRSSDRNAGLLLKLRAIMNTLLGKKTAGNHRRASRKDTRRRKIYAYAATGFVVFAVLMTVVLATGGKAASVQPSRTQLAQALPSPEYSVASQSAVPPTPTPVVTTPPESTADATQAPTEKPTVEPTQKPTEKSTEKTAEKPTEKPDPTPTKEPVATTEPDPTPPPITVADCLDFFVVEAETYYNVADYSSNYYEYTDDEKYLLAQIIEIEARGEEFKGLVAVGNVVMNRVLNSHEFQNTITDVITSGAFAYEKYKDRQPSTESSRAASAVLDDQYWVIPQNVYYFNSNMPEGENWSSHAYFTKVGGHCFYTHNYSGRNNSDAIPPQLFDRTYKHAQYGCKKDERVKRIQYMLNKLDFGVSADGVFGKGTMKALMVFQESKGLEADGVAGPATIKALIKAYGLENYYEKYGTD